MNIISYSSYMIFKLKTTMTSIILIFIFIDDNEGIMQVLYGNPNYNCPRNTRIVRVFTSSTFTGWY